MGMNTSPRFNSVAGWGTFNSVLADPWGVRGCQWRFINHPARGTINVEQ